MRTLKLCGALLSAGALYACTVGPNYVKPDLAPPHAFESQAGGSDTATLSRVTADEADLAAWWRQFGDPELDSLVGRALKGNLTLAQAGARIRQAKEQVIVARAAGLPTLSATSMAARIDTKGRQITSLGRGAGGVGAEAAGAGGAAAGSDAAGGASGGLSIPNRAELFSVGLNAAWELDLFGKARRGVEAARAQEEAQVWTARDSQVGLVSQLADAYLQLRTQQTRLGVLNADLERQRGLFKIISDRFRAGLVTNLDVDQQRTQLANTESQIPQVESDIAAQRHAIAILLGEPPEALADELKPTGALPPAPPTLPAGVPSDLLRRRPDIRASERRLAAANAQIGVATAQMFPTLNLSLLPTYSEIAISDMFMKPSGTLLSLAQGSAPLFQGGKLRAGVRQAQAAYDEAYFAYKETALTALRETEDAIARYDADQRRWTSVSGAFKAATSASGIARQQYEAGLVDYTSVYQAQASLLAVQDQLTQADAALATDVVAIYKAIGGGWGEADQRTFAQAAR